MINSAKIGLKKPSRPSYSTLLDSTFKTFKNKPAVYLPFIIFAFIEFATLIILFLAPRVPFIDFLGPPIRRIYGEGFLHYPVNFLLLPKLAMLSRSCLCVIIGSLLTGIAIAKAYNKPAKTAFKNYLSLFLILLIFTVLLYFFSKLTPLMLVKYFAAGHSQLLFLSPMIWMGPILFSINLIILLVFQSVFIYAIPELIISEKKFLRAIFYSFNFWRKNFTITLLQVGLPILIYLPVVVLNDNIPFLIEKTFPEIVLLIGIIGIIISSLIIDPLVTISTSLFYFKKNPPDTELLYSLKP